MQFNLLGLPTEIAPTRLYLVKKKVAKPAEPKLTMKMIISM